MPTDDIYKIVAGLELQAEKAGNAYIFELYDDCLIEIINLKLQCVDAYNAVLQKALTLSRDDSQTNDPGSTDLKP